MSFTKDTILAALIKDKYGKEGDTLISMLNLPEPNQGVINLLDNVIDGVSTKDSIVVSSRDVSRNELVGYGGYGQVYKIKNHLDMLSYAIKFIPIEDEGTNLLREVQHMSRLQHPNIVRYHNSWLDIIRYNDIVDDISEALTTKNDFLPCVCIQMEWCETNLEELIRKELSTETIIDIIKQMQEGIKFLHSKSIIHRDIKPSNILIKYEDNKPIVKIADLGLAKSVKNISPYKSEDIIKHSSRNTIYIGSVIYSHQNLLDGKAYSFEVDWYSFSLTVIEFILKPNTWSEKIRLFQSIKDGTFEPHIEDASLKLVLADTIRSLKNSTHCLSNFLTKSKRSNITKALTYS